MLHNITKGLMLMLMGQAKHGCLCGSPVDEPGERCEACDEYEAVRWGLLTSIERAEGVWYRGEVSHLSNDALQEVLTDLECDNRQPATNYEAIQW